MYQLMCQVLEFHERMGQPIGDPRDPDTTVEQDFRLALIDEEYKELRAALAGYHRDRDGTLIAFKTKQEQIAAVADGLGDLAYVIAGAGVVWGLDLGPVSDAIHASNMTKDPHPTKKVTKGPRFKPVDLEAVLEESRLEFVENPDFIGDIDDGAYWPTPRKERAL